MVRKRSFCFFNKLKNFKKRNLKSIINLLHSGSKGLWLCSQSFSQLGKALARLWFASLMKKRQES